MSGSVRIDTSRLFGSPSVVVTITRPDGSAPAAYVDGSLSTPAAFPQTIAASTSFYFSSSTALSVSVKLYGTEIATDSRVPAVVFLEDGQQAVIAPSADKTPDAFAPAAVQRPSLLLGLPVATNRGNSFGNTTLSDGVATSGNNRLSHYVRVSCSDLRLVYSNFGAGIDGPNAISVQATVEPPTSSYTSAASVGTVMPVYFQGQSSVTIAPGGFAISDPIPLTATAGQIIYSRTYVSVASAGQKWPTTMYAGPVENLSGGTTATNEGFDTGAPATIKLAASGTTNIPAAAGRTYSPSAIIAVPQTNKRQTNIALVGDSIMFGSGDSFQDLGFGVRACDSAGLPWVNVALPGEASTGFTAYSARHRLSLIVGCTDAIFEYGRNDFNPTPTLATVQANLLAAWNLLSARGINVRQTTITPRCSSTDGFTTLVNQTILNSATQEPNRVALNAWIRDGAPILNGVAVAAGSSSPGTIRAGQGGHPLVGYYEVTNIVESSPGAGTWKPADRVVSDAAITASSATLTSASASFTPADNGKCVSIAGAGSAGAYFFTNIQTYVSPTQVTLATTASTTVSSASAGIGTYTADGLHPTGQGHRAIAATLTLPSR